MSRAKVSDGKSVKTVADQAYTDGDFAVVNGFAGFVIGDAETGEDLVINIEQAEYEFVLTGVVEGDLVYATPTGTLTLTASGNRKVIRATTDSDSNDVVWGVLLSQQ